MDFVDKIKILGESARFDICGDCFISEEVKRAKDINLSKWIYPVTMPDGREIRLLKVLLSNSCENDCAYCPISKHLGIRRISFRPEELAEGFMRLYRKNIVSGLFLSSGVKHNPELTMQELIDTAYILRNRYNFRGYIHLKILPGASLQSLEMAVKLASRVSINLEVPLEKYLSILSLKKDFKGDLLPKLKKISDFKRASPVYLRDGFTTQFVVGAAGEKDKEILLTVFELYKNLSLTRAYYSAFQPVPGSPLENYPSTPPIREYRLYQADFLIRKYGFDFSELVFEADGNLNILSDPKTIWAKRHPDFFPVEIMNASYEELLRVPGIGPRSAKKIVSLRKKVANLSVDVLLKLIPTFRRAMPYITIKGKKLVKGFKELSLFGV
ncbi:MAG: putative DNA modification/repair radical SAM protein [candidate division WOR-3 bacterium]